MFAGRKTFLWALALSATMVLVSLTAAAPAHLASATSVGGPGATASGAAEGALASTHSTPSALTASSAATVNPSGLAIEQRVLAQAKSDHLPIEAVSLPDLLGRATVSNGLVQPTITNSPAPMGIGAFGVRNTTGVGRAFNLETQSWEGSITLDSVNTFLLDNDGAISTNGSQNTFGVQLNAVTTGTTVGSASNYSFWTQNVLYFNFPSPGQVTFLDNVWNFSSPAVSLTSGTLYSYNGTPVYPSYYYDFGPTYSITFPVTVHLFLNSSVTDIGGTGYSTVRFGYEIVNAKSGRSEGSGVYDTVLFNSTTPYASVPPSPFLVDGSQVTPTGYLPYDAELMIGGPGGGTTTSIYGISGTESLQYLNSTRHAYANAPSAWNVAGDTGETSEGIAESYTSAGTVDLSAGPSIPMGLWNATPGGNLGQATFSGPLSPSNAFVFFTPGSTFNANEAAWAPTQTASSVDFVLPPGTYTVSAMLSDHTPLQTTVTGRSGGHVGLTLALATNPSEGVYTPLFAWNNGQLAAISQGGSGTAGRPYLLDNNPASGGLNSVFGQFNDYLYAVFPGVLLAGTTAHVDLNNPSLLGVTYQTDYQAVLTALDLPSSNNLQFEFFDASYVSLWGAQGISGWFFFEDYGPTGFLPLANVVVWGGTQDLVGDNTFLSQGSSLLLAGLSPTTPTGNVVWGNTFENSSVLTPTMYPGDGVSNGPPIAIFAFESGDLIYNNWVGTSITAYAPNANLFTGAPQVNAEDWNLPMVEPASYVNVVNGYSLGGTIVPSQWQGGNYWADYVPGSPLPYDEYGYIATGGDFFPYPITAYAVDFLLVGTGGTWSVTLNGVSQTTSTHLLVFYETPGTYSFTAQLVSGRGTITPATGTISVVNQNQVVLLTQHP